MAMVISPKYKILTLAILICIIILVAMIIFGLASILENKDKHQRQQFLNFDQAKTMSSKLQHFTGYKNVSYISSMSLDLVRP